MESHKLWVGGALICYEEGDVLHVYPELHVSVGWVYLAELDGTQG